MSRGRIGLRGLLLSLGLVTAASGSLAACPEAPQPTLPQSELTIETRTGRHSFTVELASSETEKACGLMRRQRLARDEGMLFDYRPGGPAYMWMADTIVPLDMLFIGPRGRIVHVEERTTPFSHEPVGTPRTVAAVLEIVAGTVDRLEIRPGDRIYHPILDEDH